MSIAIKSFIQSELALFEDEIFEIIMSAWKQYQELEAGFRYDRTRACAVNDYIIQTAMDRWGSLSQVRISQRNETALFIFNQVVALRFKKAGSNGLGSNNPTQASLAFDNAQEDIPGIPNVQKVEVLYELNDLHTKIRRVSIAARDGSHKMWDYEIVGSGAEVVTPEFPAPSLPSQTNVVRLRGLGSQSKSGNENKK